MLAVLLLNSLRSVLTRFRFALIRFAQSYSDSLHFNPIYSTLICSISIRSIPLHSTLHLLHFNPIYFFTLIRFWFDSFRFWFVSNHFSLLRPASIGFFLFRFTPTIRIESSRVESRARRNLLATALLFSNDSRRRRVDSYVEENRSWQVSAMACKSYFIL